MIFEIDYLNSIYSHVAHKTIINHTTVKTSNYNTRPFPAVAYKTKLILYVNLYLFF
jgi:hypothetical protein